MKFRAPRSILLLFLCAGLIAPAAGGASSGRVESAMQTTAGWVKYSDNPVLGGSLGTCFDVCLLKEHGLFRMWFSWRPKASVALTESRDGIHWSAPIIVLGPDRETGWEDDVNRPVVVKHGRLYRMWYTGQAHGHSAIGCAASNDGRVWKRMSEKPVLSPQAAWEKVAVMCPDVIWDRSLHEYRMWYSGGDQYEPNAIGYATSPDGLIWTKSPENPIFRPDPANRWEQDRVTACQVVPVRGQYIMFYIGFENENFAQIGLARSPDGIHDWERHPENPIVRAHGSPDDWDYDAVYKPFALFDNGRWLLWYNGRRGGMEQIGLATRTGRDLWPRSVTPRAARPGRWRRGMGR